MRNDQQQDPRLGDFRELRLTLDPAALKYSDEELVQLDAAIETAAQLLIDIYRGERNRAIHSPIKGSFDTMHDPA